MARVSALLLSAAGLLLVPGQAWADRYCKKVGSVFAATLFIVVELAAMLIGAPASAACIESGTTATCSGFTDNGSGTNGYLSSPSISQINVQSGATVSGDFVGVVPNAIGVTINNSGSIIGRNSDATEGTEITINNYGSLTSVNAAAAIDIFSINSGGRSTINNYGTLSAKPFALSIFFQEGVGAPPQIFTVLNTGAIYGTIECNCTAPTTITNFGTISGQGSSAILFGRVGGGDSFILNNHGTILGSVGTNTGKMTVSNDGAISGSLSAPGGGSTVTNNSSGTIDGTISLTGGANVLNNSGLITITSATGIGSQHSIDGNFTQTASGTLSLRVSPSGANDKMNVTGAAALAGTFTALGTGGTYAVGQRYTVLNATGGLSGAFGGVSATGIGFLRASLSYDFQSVYLTIQNGAVSAVLPQSSSSNVRGVSLGIDNAVANGTTPPSAFNTLLGLTGSALTNALTQISGEPGAGGGRQAGTHMMGSFLALALNPHAGSPGGNPGGVGIGRGFAAEARLPPEAAYAYAAVTPKDRQTPSSVFSPNWAIWGQAYGGYNKTDGDTNAGTHDTTANSYGFATGLDYLFSRDTMIGFALAGGATNYSLSAGLGSGRSDVFQVGVYGTKKFGAAYVSAALSYAAHWMTTNRTVTVAGTDNLAANFNAHSIGARLESGYRFDAKFVGVTPYAALQVQNFRTPSYTETATSGSNAFALSYDAKSTTAVRTEIGAWFDKTMAVYGGSLVTLRTRAAWAHDHSSNESASAVFQTLPGSNFTVNGAGTVPNSALLSAGGELRLAGGVSLGAKFDGEFAGRSQTYAGTGTVRYAW